LNIFPGNVHRPVYDREAPWNDPRKSLDFLREDLKSQVGDSGRPVILVWHYGLRGWGLDKWWAPEDLANLKATIAPYNVVLILHGHEHAFASYEWEGYRVFMCPSPQLDRDPKKPELASTPKGFLVVRLKNADLQVAHHDATGWRETWSKAVSLGK
jgi:cytolysin (calcineurin-like family phosphatase)